MKTIALMLGCLLFSATEIHAADAPKDLSTLPILKQPLPSGELIQQAPDPCRWIITSSIASTDAPAAPAPNAVAPKPAIVTVTKSGKSYLVESTTFDGKKMVRWKDSQLQATYLPDLTNPLISNGAGSLYYIDFATTDFPELSWISSHNYVGMTKLGAGMAMVFKASVATRDSRMGLLSFPHPTQADAIAVVDVATHKPLMLQVDNEIIVYQFSPGGAEVSLPPEVQQAFAALRKQIQRASMVPPG